ncbi:MAG: response regulator [Terriglobia bacterium]
MKKISVLVVDDSSVVRKIVERSLRNAGFELQEVIEAENGLHALDLLEGNSVDLILSDINMPRMDGIEFLRRLQGLEKARNIPVLMITTVGSEQRVLEAISLGALGYIRKPFSAEQVRDQVARVLAC